MMSKNRTFRPCTTTRTASDPCIVASRAPWTSSVIPIGSMGGVATARIVTLVSGLAFVLVLMGIAIYADVARLLH